MSFALPCFVLFLFCFSRILCLWVERSGQYCLGSWSIFVCLSATFKLACNFWCIRSVKCSYLVYIFLASNNFEWNLPWATCGFNIGSITWDYPGWNQSVSQTVFCVYDIPLLIFQLTNCILFTRIVFKVLNCVIIILTHWTEQRLSQKRRKRK